jgi:hypothetical protein
MTNRRRINNILAAVVAGALALGASSASAMPIDPGSTWQYVSPPIHVRAQAFNGPRHSVVSCGDVCSGHGYVTVSDIPSLTPQASSGGGFDWGDASIGAAGGVAVSLLGLGGAMAISQRRTRRAESALTS